MSTLPGDNLSVLDPRLDELPFTQRFRDMAAAKGATTLWEVARIPPYHLVANPSLVSSTVEDARVILERFLGRKWEEMAGLTPPQAIPPDAPPRLPVSWDELRLVLPSLLRTWLLDDLDELPPRLLKLAAHRRLRTLGELATLSEAQLMSAGGIGRVAVRHLFRTVSGAASRAGARVTLPPPVPVGDGGLAPPPLEKQAAPVPSTTQAAPPPSAKQGAPPPSTKQGAPPPSAKQGALGPPPSAKQPSPVAEPRQTLRPPAPVRARKGTPTGLLATWQHRLQALAPEQRRAMVLHAGLDGGPRLTSAAVGAEMGISGAQAFRLDAQARGIFRQQRVWMNEVRTRVAAALREPRVRLAKLAGDPWWADIVLLPQALDYFTESVLQEASVVDTGGKLYLVR